MCKPIACAASSKLTSIDDHLSVLSVNKAASSASSWSVNRDTPTNVRMLTAHLSHLESMQSIAIQKRAGARMQLWRTPYVVSNGWDSWPATRTRDVIPRWRSSIRLTRKGGALVLSIVHSGLQNRRLPLCRCTLLSTVDYTHDAVQIRALGPELHRQLSDPQ